MAITNNTQAPAASGNAGIRPVELGEAFAGLRRFCGEPPDSKNRQLCEAAAGLLRAVATLVEAAARSTSPSTPAKPEEGSPAPEQP